MMMMMMFVVVAMLAQYILTDNFLSNSDYTRQTHIYTHTYIKESVDLILILHSKAVMEKPLNAIQMVESQMKSERNIKKSPMTLVSDENVCTTVLKKPSQTQLSPIHSNCFASPTGTLSMANTGSPESGGKMI
jgi:hypothetical protein